MTNIKTNIYVELEPRGGLMPSQTTDIDVYDGYADFTYSDPELATKTFEKMKKKGKFIVKLQGFVLTQYFEGKTRKDIVDMLVRDIRFNKIKSLGLMKINWVQKDVEII